MSGSRLVFRNVLSTFGTQIFSWILTFVVMLFLPKYLGVDVLGKFAFASSIVVLVSAVVPLGTSAVLIKEIARDRGRTGELLIAAMVVRIPLAFVMALVALLAGRLLGCPPLTHTFLLLLSIGMIIGTANDLLSSALRGQENLPRQNLAIIIDKVLGSGLTVALIMYRAPFWTFAATGIFTAAVSLIVNLTAFASLRSNIRYPTRSAIRSLVLAGIPFAGWAIFQNLYGGTDPIVLGIVCDNRAVGWYAAAVRLTGMTVVFPVSLCSALMPTLARLYTQNQVEFKQVVRHMVALVTLCAIPIAAIFICIPEKAIALLHYPHTFYGTIPVLRAGGFGVLLYSIAMVLATAVVAGDGQRKMFRTSIIAVFIGVPACVIGSMTTQRIWNNGALGAMWSDLLLEVYLIQAYIRMLPADTFVRGTIALIGRCLCASLPLLVLAAFTGGSYSTVWRVATGVLIYMLVCWRLKCLDPQILVLMRKAVTRRQHMLTQN
jgi:O-antigen/teichoic acid export membrane protein